MTTFKTSLIDLNATTSTVTRESFDANKLTQMAQLIIQLNGCSQPFTVKEVGVDKWQVVDGHFQYWAYVVASELDDNIEMARAYIATDEQIELVALQQALINGTEQIVEKTTTEDSAFLEWEMRDLTNTSIPSEVCSVAKKWQGLSTKAKATLAKYKQIECPSYYTAGQREYWEKAQLAKPAK